MFFSTSSRYFGTSLEGYCLSELLGFARRIFERKHQLFPALSKDTEDADIVEEKH